MSDGVFWVGSGWTTERVATTTAAPTVRATSLMTQLAGDEHAALMMLVRERDALRAQVAEAAERLDEFGQCPTLADGIQAMRLRMLTLRAQVEAARKVCVNTMALGDDVRPRDILDAMDEAAKK